MDCQALRCNSTTRQLQTKPTSFRQEVYVRDSEKSNDLRFSALVSHKLSIQKAKEDTAGSNAALATLQASLAEYEKHKEDNR